MRATHTAGEGIVLHTHGVAPREIMPLSLERLRERASVALPVEAVR